MKKTSIVTLFIALLFNSLVLAQVEDLPVKGVIPFELKEHLMVIECKINGSSKPYNLLLDTGGLTFIDRKVAEELGLKIRGNMAKMDTLEMGEVSIPNIFAFMGFNFKEFERYGVPLYGIIGSNLLERFKVTLDYRNLRVILSPDKEDTGESDRGWSLKFTNHRVNYAPMIDCTINSNISVKSYGRHRPAIFCGAPSRLSGQSGREGRSKSSQIEGRDDQMAGYKNDRFLSLED